MLQKSCAADSVVWLQQCMLTSKSEDIPAVVACGAMLPRAKQCRPSLHPATKLDPSVSLHRLAPRNQTRMLDQNRALCAAAAASCIAASPAAWAAAPPACCLRLCAAVLASVSAATVMSPLAACPPAAAACQCHCQDPVHAGCLSTCNSNSWATTAAAATASRRSSRPQQAQLQWRPPASPAGRRPRRARRPRGRRRSRRRRRRCQGA